MDIPIGGFTAAFAGPPVNIDIDVRELAWAAGLFEGEGCIYLHLPKRSKDGARNGRPQIRLSLAMCDEDAVERFHLAVGGLGRRSRTQQFPNHPHWKPSHRWNAYSFEHCQAIIAMLWFGLGERRRAKCVESMSAVVMATYSERVAA